MAAPPAKRQRKLVVLSSDDETEGHVAHKKTSNPQVSSRLTTSASTEPSQSSRCKIDSSSTTSPGCTRTRAISTSPMKIGKKRPRTKDGEASWRSLHAFFPPATEQQRWSARKSKTKPSKEWSLDNIEDGDDLIEDDYGSYAKIFTDQLSKERGAESGSYTSSQDSYKQVSHSFSHSDEPCELSRPMRRFMLPRAPHIQGTGVRVNLGTRSGEVDRRPWFECYAPSHLDELAVHKKKVSEVQSWLTDALAGKSNRKMLILNGPAGSGKTTTVSLLSQVFAFDVVEWKNPLGSDQSNSGYTSLGAQFDEFLGRSNVFSSLELDDACGPDTGDQYSEKLPMKRLILIEEFPSTLARASSALATFRSSLHQVLVASRHSQRTASFGKSGPADLGPPVVIVVSETLLNTITAVSDNLTMHRLLGPEICDHPATTVIEFNRIAPTFMFKALDLVLRKEARQSMRKRIPGPSVLKRFSELGDIRSAISSLEFLCLRGDGSGGWGGRVAAELRNPSRDTSGLTLMEKQSLEMVTQREASLGLFHAVGKVLYNKRDDQGSAQHSHAEFEVPPAHLSRFGRLRASRVSVEDLISEIGTDIQTFISAVHENYVPSCDGPSFTEFAEGCIQYLSDSDILGSDSYGFLQANRTGVGVARSRHQSYGATVDALRQDEISFHVAVRGILFALPDPVRRRLGPSLSGRRLDDVHKMFFPTSLRLRKEAEELQCLVDAWGKRVIDPNTVLQNTQSVFSQQTRVGSWRLSNFGPASSCNRESHDPALSAIATIISCDDRLLHYLPYMAKIWSGKAEAIALEKLIQFHGIATSSEDMLEDERADFTPLPVGDWSTDSKPLGPERRSQPSSSRHNFNRTYVSEFSSRVEAAAEKLVLSDDDIEDD